MTSIDRRRVLAFMGAGGLGSACMVSPDIAASLPSQEGVFRHGVASGDPDTESVVIWTRILPDAGITEVGWVVARDENMQGILASGISSTSAARDWTVKVLVGNLLPGQVCYYQFSAAGERSPIGRTRTLAEGHLDKVGIALASCSNYAFGHFNAYAAIAADPSVDFVLHTGDYIYEYGGEGSWGHAQGEVLARTHHPPHETVTLSDYRMRHAQYKSDPGSRAMHAAHPLLCCWDDHESTNNPWRDGAENHQPETEGDWAMRRAASVQAYYEWMPVRDPEPGADPLEFWRTYRFGSLATLVTLETRHTARGEQVDYAAWQPRLKTDEDYENFRNSIIADPERRMLSDGMEARLFDAFRHSVETGQPWRLVGNPSPIARMLVPDLVGEGILPPPDAQSIDAHRRLAWLGKHRLPFYTDTWDGYPVARERLYELCGSAGARDVIFLTGDSHSFWINQLSDGKGMPVGIELGTAGITSPGDFIESGFSDEQAAALDKAFASLLDEVVWTDNFHQGYVRVILTHHRVRADFLSVNTVLVPDAAVRLIRSAEIIHDEGRLMLTQ